MGELLAGNTMPENVKQQAFWGTWFSCFFVCLMKFEDRALCCVKRLTPTCMKQETKSKNKAAT